MNDVSLNLDDSVIEVLFAGSELPDPYVTNGSIFKAIRRRATARLLKYEERDKPQSLGITMTP